MSSVIKKQSAGQEGGSGRWKEKGRTRASKVKYAALLSLPKENDQLSLRFGSFFFCLQNTPDDFLL